MKIAIISDIHENFHNLILALQAMQRREIEQILCLGDLINPGIAKVLATQDIPTFMIWGNNDGDRVEITLASKSANSVLTVSSKTYDFLQLGGKNIFISHYEDLAEPMATSRLYDAVFFGHNHLQSLEKIDDCWLVNPGELAASKTKKATFAIYDTLNNEVDIITLKDSVSLKTPLMENYFKTHAAKMNLRSAKAMGLANMQNDIIPSTSPIYKTLDQLAQTAKTVVFSGLPGVGKSLYINQFQLLAKTHHRKVTIIQWDIARKAFETPEIATRYPIGESMVHNGLKLCAGKWLLDTVKDWVAKHQNTNDLLLIEAPLVGHRFIELMQIQSDQILETFLKSEAFQVIVPIPSKTVRAKIEADRKAQVAEDAKTWVGAKPSVMLLLWKMICGIANEFGKNIAMDGQPAYDPVIYEFVFRKVLKHRHFTPLFIDEIFPIKVLDEKDLHNTGSLAADAATANYYGDLVAKEYPNDMNIDAIVEKWYLN